MVDLIGMAVWMIFEGILWLVAAQASDDHQSAKVVRHEPMQKSLPPVGCVLDFEESSERFALACLYSRNL